jgi:hypothetical protein
MPGDRDLWPVLHRFRRALTLRIHYDDREESLEQQKSPSLSQSLLNPFKSAQPDEAQTLKLKTVGPANLAYLEQDAAGDVCLYFRGLHFGVDDYVPKSLIQSQSISSSGTAGEFVCRQMLTHYGYREDDWPILARQFLMKHRTCRPDRSESKR